MNRILVLLSLVFVATQARAQLLDIDFGAGTPPLPYTEDGVTFGTSPIGYIAHGALRAGGLAGTVHAEASDPFNLHAFEVEAVFRSWRIETSAGGVFQIPGVGLHDLTAIPGFRAIRYFNIVTNDDSNPLLNVNRLQISYVPEPATGAMLFLGALAFAGRRRRVYLNPDRQARIHR